MSKKFKGITEAASFDRDGWVFWDCHSSLGQEAHSTIGSTQAKDKLERYWHVLDPRYAEFLFDDEQEIIQEAMKYPPHAKIRSVKVVISQDERLYWIADADIEKMANDREIRSKMERFQAKKAEIASRINVISERELEALDEGGKLMSQVQLLDFWINCLKRKLEDRK